jgi:hypothetical protein
VTQEVLLAYSFHIVLGSCSELGVTIHVCVSDLGHVDT